MRHLAPILLLAGCTQPVPVTDSQPTSAPRVVDSSRFEELDGQEVLAVGTYVQVDVRKRVPDGGDPVYRGHTAVRLADDHRLHIEPTWSDAAVRDPGEIANFDGKGVIVGGTLNYLCPTLPEPIAAIISPCLSNITTIQPQ